MDQALNELVDAVESGSVELADTMLRDGAVCLPTVHLLSKHLAQPYLGSVATRPFRRGADAATAVAALGQLPAVVTATRLVVVWEYGDMCTALGLPDERVGRLPRGLVVLDADLSRHVVRWHPFTLRANGLGRPAPTWGTPVRHPAGWLPEPVSELLAVWRELRRGDIAAVRAELESAGFVVTWAADSRISRRG